MTKILYKDHERLARESATCQAGVSKLNAVITAVKIHSPETPIKSPDDIRDIMLEGAARWCKQKLIVGMGPLKIAGFTIRPDKALDIISLPDFAPIQKTIDEAEAFLGSISRYSWVGGQLVFDQAAVERLIESCTIYCGNRQIEKYIEHLERTAAAIYDLNKAAASINGISIHPDNPLRRYFKFLPDGPVEVNGSFLLEQLEQLRAAGK